MNDVHPMGMSRVRRVHFVGIGGAGMSGIAEVLVNQGYQVSGSDIDVTPATEHLAKIGVRVHQGHAAEQLGDSDVLVYSSAIQQDNPELLEAGRRRIPLVTRAEMLAELMRFSYGIAIAGTHGKTTTTSLIASIFAEAGLDPTYVIGGVLNKTGSHSCLGQGKYFVAEADESDASFLHLSPLLSVLTNIDADHLEHYQGDYERLHDHFVRFVHQLPFYGLVVVCADDENIRKMIPSFARQTITYGMDYGADYTAHVLSQKGAAIRFQVHKKGCVNWLETEWNMLGKYNIRNALAAIAVADDRGVDKEVIAHSLSNFQGISRRAELKGSLRFGDRHCLLIDDYAHHPTEIRQVVNAARAAWEGRRLVCVFQPHRHTRVYNLFEDFCHALEQVDILLLLDVYAAGEAAIPGADSRSLCRAIRSRGSRDPVFVEDRKQVCGILENLVEEDDVLLVLGAGDIHSLATELCAEHAA